MTPCWGSVSEKVEGCLVLITLHIGSKLLRYQSSEGTEPKKICFDEKKGSLNLHTEWAVSPSLHEDHSPGKVRISKALGFQM
jgi:hypothetical protein